MAAVLHLSPLCFLPWPSSPPDAAKSTLVRCGSYGNPQKYSQGVSVATFYRRGKNGSAVVSRASSAESGNEVEVSKADEASSIENLPLESKQQAILEQRMKMKLAKKLRRRRKRLVQKRRLRKKGRWPPSKMRKLKNV